jgi:DNA replication and repair protein RecF
LARFRNYELLEIHPGPGLNILVGENGQGKSNLLEAIYMLATTKSFRASRDVDVVQAGHQEATVFAEVEYDGLPSRDLEITISHSDRKSARVNGARTSRVIDLIGSLNAVFFGALDLRLVNGEPSSRRRFIDLAIAQTSAAYCIALAAYKRSVDHRNGVLREMRERPDLNASLDVWTDQIVRYGAPVIIHRTAFATELATLAAEAHAELSGGRETLAVRYAPSVPCAASDEGKVAQAFDEEVQRVRESEIRRGSSLVGPHRDDLRLIVDDLDARNFASQGQQRTVVLALKLAEMQFMHEHCRRPPIMLLDDVMSDLDDDRRARLLQHVRGKCQTFVTCTNLRAFPEDILAEARVFYVRGGSVEVAGNV